MKRLLLLVVGIVLAALSLVGSAKATPAPNSFRAADIDHDNCVSVLDLGLVSAWYGKSVPPAPSSVDLDHDGAVTVLDLGLVSQWYGVCATLPAPWVGLNNWGVGQQDGFASGCGSNGQNTREPKFTLWQQKGVDVVRILATQWHALHNGARDWTALDDVFARAVAHKVKLVVPLENQWGFGPDGGCNGTTKDCAWYTTGYKAPYDGLSEGFDAWVTEIVMRYSGNPALATWEVMNEPWSATACIHNFFVDITSRIRAADAYTPISLGGSDAGGWDFKTENGIPNVTWTTVHGPYTDPASMTPWVQQRITWAAEIGKPIYVGERGLATSDCTAQANFYNGAIPASRSAGAIGFLAWAFSWSAGSTCISADFGPTSPVMDVFAAY